MLTAPAAATYNMTEALTSVYMAGVACECLFFVMTCFTRATPLSSVQPGRWVSLAECRSGTATTVSSGCCTTGSAIPCHCSVHLLSPRALPHADCSESAITSWSCGACGHLPGVKRAVFLSNQSAAGFSDIYGYTAQAADGSIILAFRGTEGIREWILDFDFIPMPFPDCPDCEIHSGFYDGWLALRDQVLAAFQSFHASAAPVIHVTGHSLGAALANVAALDLMATYKYTNLATLYNFGQPRLGNEAYAQFYEATVTNRTGVSRSSLRGAAAAAAAALGDGAGTHAYRVVHNADPVPQLPPQAFGFKHSPLEVWYTENQDSYKLCSSSNGEDPTCSDSQIDLDPADHESYLGQRISGLC